MEDLGIFPFGEPVRSLVQQDRTTKRVFVLGVYASAVHARWIGPDGREVVKALAVASEPEIFWRGDGVERIISRIPVPSGLGRLAPADDKFNGPSGRSLDRDFIDPLGITRQDAWLCDLVPYSCVNPSQKKALERAYSPHVKPYGLPVPSVPEVPKRFADEARQREIMDEIRQSEAEALLLLGDQPLRWFVSAYDKKWRRLSDFGRTHSDYGRLHDAVLDGVSIRLLPLAHPRQAAGLGRSSDEWRDLHADWIRNTAGSLLG